jgi:stage IV sporulation protein FB
MFSTGYATLGRIRGAPIHVHWSAPLGAWAFTGFQLSPGLWAGFFLLVVLHELGHAALVRRMGHEVVAIRVHAFGGDCQWSGDPTRIERAVVAWGGVLAQGLLWIAATVALAIAGPPPNLALAILAFTFTSTNARMIFFNLLPVPPLDGHAAWPLLPMLWEARKERLEHTRDRAARRRAVDEERRAERSRAATHKALEELDAQEADPPPMPDEVRAVLDRVTAEVSREAREKREKGDRG